MISSFSKKKLERLNLTRSSSEQNLSKVQLLIYQFFPENFGQQLSEEQLQQNLSTDQRQLQNTQLTQTHFQQLSLEKPSFPEKIVNNELATTFAKKSLAENLVFESFFSDNLALQKTASGELAEKNLYKKQLAQSSFTQKGAEACKDQLPADGFSTASSNKQLHVCLTLNLDRMDDLGRVPFGASSEYPEDTVCSRESILHPAECRFRSDGMFVLKLPSLWHM